MVLGTEFRSPGLHNKHLYHLGSPETFKYTNFENSDALESHRHDKAVILCLLIRPQCFYCIHFNCLFSSGPFPPLLRSQVLVPAQYQRLFPHTSGLGMWLLGSPTARKFMFIILKKNTEELIPNPAVSSIWISLLIFYYEVLNL